MPQLSHDWLPLGPEIFVTVVIASLGMPWQSQFELIVLFANNADVATVLPELQRDARRVMPRVNEEWW